MVRGAAQDCGAEYSGDLKQGVTTHLVCSDSTGTAASAKLQRAAEWGIPALQWAWLKQSAARRRLLPTGLYLYSGTGSEAAAAAEQGGSTAEPHVTAESVAFASAAEPGHQSTACGLSPLSHAAAMLEQGQRGSTAHVGGREQENLDPHAAKHAAKPPQPAGPPLAAVRGSAQSQHEAGGLAAQLSGLRLGGGAGAYSPPADGDAADGDAVSRAGDADQAMELLDAAEPLAAASAAGSCTVSEDDDDGIHCAQPSPGVDQSMPST